MGSGCFKRSATPLHLPNASCGLSATAEFLVNSTANIRRSDVVYNVHLVTVSYGKPLARQHSFYKKFSSLKPDPKVRDAMDPESFLA